MIGFIDVSTRLYTAHKDYNDTTAISYTATQNCWVVVDLRTNVSGHANTFHIDNVQVVGIGENEDKLHVFSIPLKTGQTASSEDRIGSYATMFVYPCFS